MTRCTDLKPKHPLWTEMRNWERWADETFLMKDASHSSRGNYWLTKCHFIAAQLRQTPLLLKYKRSSDPASSSRKSFYISATCSQQVHSGRNVIFNKSRKCDWKVSRVVILRVQFWFIYFTWFRLSKNNVSLRGVFCLTTTTNCICNWVCQSPPHPPRSLTFNVKINMLRNIKWLELVGVNSPNVKGHFISNFSLF